MIASFRHGTLTCLWLRPCQDLPSVPTGNGRGMDRFIAHANIAHLREKLASEQDETKRQMLLRLLAEEEAKLAALDHSPSRRMRSG